MFCTVPLVLGWLLISYAKNVAMLYAGRIITGLGCGAVSLTVPVCLCGGCLLSLEMAGFYWCNSSYASNYSFVSYAGDSLLVAGKEPQK